MSNLGPGNAVVTELIKWLNACITRPKNGDGVRMWALRHINADDRADPVDDWSYKSGIDVADLANDIYHTMVKDALGLRRQQQYIVEAYFGTSKVRGRRFTAEIDGADPDDEGGMSREPAGPRGEAMQQRRHIENMHKLSVGGSSEMMRILRAENERLTGMVDKLMDKHFAVVDTYESLADKKHKRELEIIKTQEDEKLKRDLFNKAAPIINFLAAKALGAPALGMGDAGGGGQAAPVSNVVTPEQLILKDIAQHVIENKDTAIPLLLQIFASNPALLAGLNLIVEKYGTNTPGPDTTQGAA